MSIKNNSILEFGLVFTENEILDFIEKYYKGEYREDFESMKDCFGNFFVENMYNEPFDNIGNFEGDFENLDGKNNKYFDEEELYIVYLDRFDTFNGRVLFQSYKDKDEIFQELKERLENYGFTGFPKDYILENVGKVNGTYFG